MNIKGLMFQCRGLPRRSTARKSLFSLRGLLPRLRGDRAAPRKSILILLVFCACNKSFAQHEHHNNNKDSLKTDTIISPDNQHKIEPHQHQHEMNMTGGVLLTDAMSQEGSGTSWLPKSSPMHMAMYHSGNWMFMLHGALAVRYTHQGGLRGRDGFSSPNWLMGSAQRKLSDNTQVMFRTMLSLDRLTEGGEGYPLLFQTGELWNGVPLVDEQHPHDIFSELAVSLSAKLSKTLSGYVYFGYPGEPALGPPVFMHRPSALSNPDAPISHHWQDATHITFGVGTLGLAFKNIKLEGSVFTGREPDENRFDFDKPRFDSYSGRLSYNPAEDFSLQVSAGFIKNPEGDSIDVVRRTASLLYSHVFNHNNNFAGSLIWGQNKDGFAGAQNSFVAEGEYYLAGNSFYTRLEFVEKTRHELEIEDNPSQKETIGAYTVGYKRKLISFSGLDLNAGLQGTLYSVPDDIKSYYGNNPVSYQVYIQILPEH